MERLSMHLQSRGNSSEANRLCDRIALVRRAKLEGKQRDSIVSMDRLSRIVSMQGPVSRFPQTCHRREPATGCMDANHRSESSKTIEIEEKLNNGNTKCVPFVDEEKALDVGLAVPSPPACSVEITDMPKQRRNLERQATTRCWHAVVLCVCKA